MTFHDDLRFDIEPPSLEYLAKPMFSRLDTAGTAQAGSALRAYMALSRRGLPQIPGLEMGRVHVPRYKIREWNNIPLDAPLPSLVIAAADTDGTEYFCQMFSDRSALFFAPEDESIGDPEVSLLRVLPVAFRLSNKMMMKGQGKPWAFSLKADQDNLELLANCGSKSRNFLEFWPSESKSVQMQHAVISSLFEQEICAWSREIRKLPWITKTALRPSQGRFGVDAEPPEAGLEGTPYAWPMAMPYEGFTPEEFSACQRFLRLAWTYLLDTEARECPDGEVAILAARPSQVRDRGRIQVKIQFLGPRGERKDAATRRVKQAMDQLMHHPKAPEGLWTMTGAGLMETHRGGRKSDNLESYILFHGRMGRDVPSAHDRMEAYALFKD